MNNELEQASSTIAPIDTVVQRVIAQPPTRPCVAISTRVAECSAACSDTPEFDDFRARRAGCPTVVHPKDGQLTRPTPYLHTTSTTIYQVF